MLSRQAGIGSSILRAIFSDSTAQATTLVARVLIFFSLFQLTLALYKREIFFKLRSEVWQIDEGEYRESFRRKNKKSALEGVGDLGYSGSSFFTTTNSKFLIKSIPRRFEYSFFRDRMLIPYSEHMRSNPSSLLVRITDFLYSPHISLGSLIHTVSTHHVIMENVLYGKSNDEQAPKWETYDLKPINYFFPERDIPIVADLTSEATKERLIDIFEDKIRVTQAEFDELKSLLEADTALLESLDVVDYSLFIVRIPATSKLVSVPSNAGPWRTGLVSTDGKWHYRLVLLDFLWAKYKLQAKVMTGLIDSFNLIARKGPMSITTTPKEYKARFLSMIDAITEPAPGG